MLASRLLSVKGVFRIYYSLFPEPGMPLTAKAFVRYHKCNAHTGFTLIKRN